MDNVSKVLNTKSAYFGDMPNNPEGHSVTTFFMGIRPEFYLNNVEPIFTAEDYENLRLKWGSYSNGYENMMFFAFKDKLNQVELVGERFLKQKSLPISIIGTILGLNTLLYYLAMYRIRSLATSKYLIPLIVG